MVPYIGSCGDVLNIPAREIATGKRTANDVQLKKWIGVLSIIFKPVHQKTLEDVTTKISFVIDTSADFRDPASDVPIVEDEINEENTT